MHAEIDRTRSRRFDEYSAAREPPVKAIAIGLMAGAIACPSPRYAQLRLSGVNESQPGSVSGGVASLTDAPTFKSAGTFTLGVAATFDLWDSDEERAARCG